LPPAPHGAKLGDMPAKRVKPGSGATDGVPCLLVKVNGKKVALLGLDGEGGVAATVNRWVDASRDDGRTRRSRRDNTFNVRMDVTDANDPSWHKMYVWPVLQIEQGDLVEVRVVLGTPERGRFAGKYHRTHYEEVPFEKNDTYEVIGNMATWADATRVYLKERRISHRPMMFTAAAARRVAKALVDGARRVERTRK
jgi:hypothetical protein